MLNSTLARAEDVRALAGAIVLGSSAGLVIGAAYLVGSGAHHAPASVPSAPTTNGRDVAELPTPTSSTAAPIVKVAAAQVSTSVAAVLPPLRHRFSFTDVLNRVAARPFQFKAVAEAGADETCLAEAVYFEARGEPAAGQQAVAQVVLNRVRHPAFPKTVCGVVHQRTASSCQFHFACTADRPATGSAAWRRSEAVASAALHGTVMAAVGDATHFQTARGGPFAGLLKVAQIGAHVFYRFGGHAGSADMFHQTPAPSAAPEPRLQFARLDETPGRVHAVIDMAAPAEPERAEVVKTESAKPVVATAVARADAVPAKLVVAARSEVARSDVTPSKSAATVAPAVKPAEAVAAPKPAATTVALAQS